MVFGAALLLGVGLAFVCAVRSFVFLALAAAIIVGGIDSGTVLQMIVSGVIAFVLCQVGYGLGLGLRALTGLRRPPVTAPRREGTELPHNVGGQQQ